MDEDNGLLGVLALVIMVFFICLIFTSNLLVAGVSALLIIGLYLGYVVIFSLIAGLIILPFWVGKRLREYFSHRL